MDSDRAVVWLLVPGGGNHAFHRRGDGRVGRSVCGRYADGSAWIDRVGSRRHGQVCGQCKSTFATMPKVFGDPCGVAVPGPKGTPCRNCGVPIEPTFPGWRHRSRKQLTERELAAKAGDDFKAFVRQLT